MKTKIFFLALTFLVFGFGKTAEAIYISQCTGTDCTHDNDEAILREQCRPLIGVTTRYTDDVCSSMPNYLSAMARYCNEDRARGSSASAGVNCDMIARSGFYGQEAYQYAYYVDSIINPYESGRTAMGSTGTNEPFPDLRGNSVGSTGSTGSAGALANSGAIPLPTGFGLPDPAGGITEIMKNLLRWMLEIIGIVALIAFVISGFQYFFAAGDEKLAETAKRNMTYAVLGIIVALSGLVVIRAVDYFLRAGSLF